MSGCQSQKHIFSKYHKIEQSIHVQVPYHKPHNNRLKQKGPDQNFNQTSMTSQYITLRATITVDSHLSIFIPNH